MAVADGNPEKLTEIAKRAQKALDDNDPVAIHHAVRDLADQVGTDGLVEIWKSDS